MFGFDGVACQRCAQRRAKRFLAISAGLELAILPLVLAVLITTSTILPPQLGLLLLIIFGAIIFTLLPLGIWAWGRGWRVVTTPLAVQPSLMTLTAQRLAEKAMVGDTIRYKRVATLNT
jgi:hypothetical protein